MADLRINPEPDIDELLRHWVEVFDVPETIFTPVWHAKGPERRFVAEAREDGKLVSTVAVYAFEAQVGDGTTVGMAGVANVATLASHRGKGYSGELLKIAKAQMHGGYSLLFTGVPPHYAKVGYELIPEWTYTVLPVGTAVAPTSSPDKERVQALHAKHSPAHPGSVVRDADWWRLATWFRTESRQVWADEDAYLFADYGDGRLSIIEAFGDPAALACLVNGAGCWAKEDGAAEVVSRVGLPEYVDQRNKQFVGGAMVLPLALDREGALAVSATPGFGFLGIDHF